MSASIRCWLDEHLPRFKINDSRRAYLVESSVCFAPGKPTSTSTYTYMPHPHPHDDYDEGYVGSNPKSRYEDLDLGGGGALVGSRN